MSTPLVWPCVVTIFTTASPADDLHRALVQRRQQGRDQIARVHGALAHGVGGVGRNGQPGLKRERLGGGDGADAFALGNGMLLEGNHSVFAQIDGTLGFRGQIADKRWVQLLRCGGRVR